MSDDPKKPDLVTADGVTYQFKMKDLSDLLNVSYPATVVATNTIFPGSAFSELAASGSSFPYLDQEKVRSLEDQIRTLRDDLTKQARTIQEERSTSAEHQSRVAELTATLDKLTKKEQLAFLLRNVSTKAADVLLDSEPLRTKFLSPDAPSALFAMSVDIRRSTDLMLKARTPQAFATFITNLCKDLGDVVRNFHGVVDKFTGDGILCFFPEFFSGPDAGYYALAAADACHSTFESHYRAHRGSFRSVLKEVGLGIGVDYGECHLVQVAGSLTIVGVPVVYACRLGGAPAGKTLLNQPAYEAISEKHGGRVLLNETSIEIKHEGVLFAYEATLSRSDYQPAQPAWMDAKKAVSDSSAGAAGKASKPASGPSKGTSK